MLGARLATSARTRLTDAGLAPAAAQIVGASLATAAAAHLAVPVPWSPVPLTLQTLAVLLSGALLGARRGLLAQVLYLVEGAAGLPVFAGGAAGPLVLCGPSAGYLLAFPAAAAVTGALVRVGWGRHFATALAAVAVGTGLILLAGVAVLAHFVPAGRLLVAGVLTFLPGDILKALVGAAVVAAASARDRGSRQAGCPSAR
jgi:biotin transport system substrate-specific component